MLYMCQMVFQSIIRSSKLHIQRQVFVRPLLLPAASLARLAAGSSNGLTLYVQFWAPDDGLKNRLTHVKHLTEINELRNVASCRLYSASIQSVSHFFHDLPFRMFFYSLWLSQSDSFQTEPTLWLNWLTHMGRNTKKNRTCTAIAELNHLWHSCIQKPLTIKKSFSKCPSLTWLCLKINCNLLVVQMNLHIYCGKLRAQTFPLASALSLTVAKHSDHFLH